MEPEGALLAVTAAHAGFQVVVSAVVYPALADVSAGSWTRGPAHADHSRRVTYVVAPLYGLLVGVCAWALLAGPVTTAGAVAVTGNVVAMATTAVMAAPTHGRLGREGRTDAAVGRLLWSDRVRTAAAVIALVGACLV